MTLAAGDYDIGVTFRFITPTETNFCEGTTSASCSSSDELRSPEGTEDIAELVQTPIVTIRFFDFVRRKSRTELFSFRRGESMQSVYELVSKWAYESRTVVCYTPAFASQPRSALRLCVQQVLAPTDAIPEVVLSHAFTAPVLPSIARCRMLVVNILTFSPRGAVVVGHIPFIITISDVATADAIYEHMCKVCELCHEEAEMVRTCPLVHCSVEQQCLRIGDLFSVESAGDQVALVFPLLEIGEVVRVALRSSECGASICHQAVVTGHSLHDGVLHYGIQDCDSSTLLCQQCCLHVIPL